MPRHRWVTTLALALSALVLSVAMAQPAFAANPQIATSTTLRVTPNELTLAYQGVITTSYALPQVGFPKRASKRAIRRKRKKLRRRQRLVQAAAEDCRKARVVFIFQNGSLVTTATSQYDGTWAATGTRPFPGTQVTAFVQRVERPQETCAESALQSAVVP